MLDDSKRQIEIWFQSFFNNAVKTSRLWTEKFQREYKVFLHVGKYSNKLENAENV